MQAWVPGRAEAARPCDLVWEGRAGTQVPEVRSPLLRGTGAWVIYISLPSIFLSEKWE